MGIEKGEIIEKEEAWKAKAKFEKLKCSECSITVPYGDREIFYETGKCAYCNHLLNKDD